jgi:hypothetical protein
MGLAARAAGQDGTTHACSTQNGENGFCGWGHVSSRHLCAAQSVAWPGVDGVAMGCGQPGMLQWSVDESGLNVMISRLPSYG